MKKLVNEVDHNKTRAKLVARSKAEKATEASLQSRKNTAVKAIVIGSAALSIAAFGFFTFNKYKKKKADFFSW